MCFSWSSRRPYWTVWFTYWVEVTFFQWSATSADVWRSSTQIFHSSDTLLQRWSAGRFLIMTWLSALFILCLVLWSLLVPLSFWTGSRCDNTSIYLRLCPAIFAYPREWQHSGNNPHWGRTWPCSWVHWWVVHSCFKTKIWFVRFEWIINYKFFCLFVCLEEVSFNSFPASSF